MAVQEIARQDWQTFLGGFAQVIGGREAAVEVASVDHGDQRLAEGVPLLGLSYDAHGDRIEIAFENLDHRIEHPQKIFVDDAIGGGLIALEIIGEGDARTILRLSDPLLLVEASRI
jgi:hypothetical protein